MMKRPDPMIAAKPGAEDVQAMSCSDVVVEELFFLMVAIKSATRNTACLLVLPLSIKVSTD